MPGAITLKYFFTIQKAFTAFFKKRRAQIWSNCPVYPLSNILQNVAQSFGNLLLNFSSSYTFYFSFFFRKIKMPN